MSCPTFERKAVWCKIIGRCNSVPRISHVLEVLQCTTSRDAEPKNGSTSGDISMPCLNLCYSTKVCQLIEVFCIWCSGLNYHVSIPQFRIDMGLACEVNIPHGGVLLNSAFLVLIYKKELQLKQIKESLNLMWEHIFAPGPCTPMCHDTWHRSRSSGTRK